MANIKDQIAHHLFGDFSQSPAKEKEVYAADVRTKCAIAASCLAPIPIPFADIWTITPVQYLMVRAIGNIYGHKIDEIKIKEIFSVIGSGIIGQQLCLALFKIGLPGAGGIGGAAFVFAWTIGIGKAAEAYFKANGNITAEELRKIRERGAAEASNQQENIAREQRSLMSSSQRHTASEKIATSSIAQNTTWNSSGKIRSTEPLKQLTTTTNQAREIASRNHRIKRRKTALSLVKLFILTTSASAITYHYKDEIGINESIAAISAYIALSFAIALILLRNKKVDLHPDANMRCPCGSRKAFAKCHGYFPGSPD